MQPSNMLKILQEHKTQNGITFQEHIRDLVKKLSKDKTKLKGYDHFEILSQLLKQTKFIYQIPKTDKEVNNIEDNVSELSDWAEKCKRLYDKVYYMNLNNIITKLHQTIIPNFISESRMLEQAGIYFGEEETYNLNFALKLIAQFFRSWHLKQIHQSFAFGENFLPQRKIIMLLKGMHRLHMLIKFQQIWNKRDLVLIN